MATIRPVKDWNEGLDAIDGVPYTLDGIHGHIKLSFFEGRASVSHEPSMKGRNTDAYRELKRKLGDDWSSDLTWSERLSDIMYELGIRFAP